MPELSKRTSRLAPAEIEDFVWLANTEALIKRDAPEVLDETTESGHAGWGRGLTLERALNQLEASTDNIGDEALLEILQRHLRGSRFFDLAQQPKGDLVGVAIADASAFIRAVRETMEKIADLPRDLETVVSKRGRIHQKPRIRPTAILPFKLDLIGGEVFRITAENTLEPTEIPLTRHQTRFRALLQSRDVSRIRRCANNCRNLFWAKRSDQLCCSERCNNARAQRDWYVRHKDEKKSRAYAREERKTALLLETRKSKKKDGGDHGQG